MISVCVATYNGETYIKEQLKSILVQLSDEDEIIISDNGSSDKTLDIISEFKDRRIQIYNYTAQKGIIPNIENAMKQAKGQYIFLADQDDIWVDGKIQMMLTEFQQGVHIVMSDAVVVDSKLNVIQETMSQWRSYHPGFICNLLRSRYIGCCMALDAYMLKCILPFPKHIKAHDVWIGLYGELTKSFLYIENPLILYRRHDNNVSTASSKSTNSLYTMLSYRVYFFVTTIYRYLSRTKFDR